MSSTSKFPSSPTGHHPVLLSEVLTQLNLQPGDAVIDATLGGGGHAAAILDRTGPAGRLLGLEADPRTLAETSKNLQRFGSRVTLLTGNFRRLTELRTEVGFPPAAAILFDLGVSSLTLDDAARGFSFQRDGPLDMRYDPAQEVSAATLLKERSRAELSDIFRRLGEEPAAERIAQAIDEARRDAPLTRTSQLADLILTVSPRHGRIHPATRVFQALRLAVNDELGALEEALPQALTALQSEGRLAVITFHSLEDRLVKQWMRQSAASGQITIVTKHVVTPSHAEIVQNPRARSAKLRMATTHSSN